MTEPAQAGVGAVSCRICGQGERRVASVSTILFGSVRETSVSDELQVAAWGAETPSHSIGRGRHVRHRKWTEQSVRANAVFSSRSWASPDYGLWPSVQDGAFINVIRHCRFLTSD